MHDPPIARDDYETHDGTSSSRTINVLDNDSSSPDDPNQSIRVHYVYPYSYIYGCAYHYISMIIHTRSSPNATVEVSSSSSVTFTPASGVYGEVAFEYGIIDDYGATDTANVTVFVVPGMQFNQIVSALMIVVDATGVTATNDVYEVDINSADNLLDVLANDFIDNGFLGSLSIVAVTQPSGENSGFVTVAGSDFIAFTPAHGFQGNTIFTYTVALESDIHLGTRDVTNPPSATATVSVTVGKCSHVRNWIDINTYE